LHICTSLLRTVAAAAAFNEKRNKILDVSFFRGGTMRTVKMHKRKSFLAAGGFSCCHFIEVLPFYPLHPGGYPLDPTPSTNPFNKQHPNAADDLTKSSFLFIIFLSLFPS